LVGSPGPGQVFDRLRLVQVFQHGMSLRSHIALAFSAAQSFAPLLAQGRSINAQSLFFYFYIIKRKENRQTGNFHWAVVNHATDSLSRVL
jgi:hypothetical protein